MQDPFWDECRNVCAVNQLKDLKKTKLVSVIPSRAKYSNKVLFISKLKMWR